MTQEHIQKQVLHKAIKDPIFARDTFSKLPTNTFNEEKSYVELALLINRYYQTHNAPLDKETLLVMAEDKLTKQNAKAEKQQDMYNSVKDLYTIDDLELNEEVIGENIQKYVRKTLITDTLMKAVSTGQLEDENMITDLISQLQDVAVMSAGGGGESINFFKDVEAKKRLLNNMNKNKFKTGFNSIDTIADGGLARGELGLILASYGSGKALPNNTNVKTPHGDVPIGDIMVGDDVFGRDGKVYQVQGVFPQGRKKVYEITLSDDTVIPCCKDHLWTYQTLLQRSREPETWQTNSLEHIMNNEQLLSDMGEYLLYIPMAEPVELPYVENSQSAYTVGVELATDESCETLIQQARKLSKGNEAQRLALLEGMSSVYNQEDDANLANSHLSFTTTAPHIVELATELVESLGGDVVTVTTGNTTELQCTLLIRMPNQTDTELEPFRAIVSIKETDYYEDMTCISVTSPDSLFLIDHYVVTHNTTWAVNLVRNYVKQGLNVLFIPLEEKLDRMILRFEQVFSQQSKDLLLAGGAVNEGFYDKIQESYDKLLNPDGQKGWGEFIIDKYTPRTLSVTGLEQSIINQTMVLGKRIDVVIIDYPDLMLNLYERGGDSESRAGGKLTEDIRRIAQDYDFVGWVFSQLNRSGVSSDFRSASMVEGSKQKLNAVEIALTVNQCEEEQAEGYTRLYVDKLRNRTSDAFERMLPFKYVSESMTLRDLTEGELARHQLIMAEAELSVGDNKKSKKNNQQATNMLAQSKADNFNQTVAPNVAI